MKNLFLALFPLLTACYQQTGYSPRMSSAPFITKGTVLYQDRMENTPVLWTDGGIVDVLWTHDPEKGVWGNQIELHRDAVVSTALFNYGYISALVANGVLYVFGTSQDGTSVAMISSTDLVTFSTPVIVLKGAGIANTSVSTDETGFVMAVEECSPTSCYIAGLYHSKTLLSWTRMGGFDGTAYSACPTVRFFNGYYYLFYLSNEGEYFATRIARSVDLIDWEVSNQAVVSPDSNEGNNASDLDLVEVNGAVKILYAIGYQTPGLNHFVNIREASYNGTLPELLEKFFN